MPAERLSVVVTRRLPEPVETRMKELFNVELRDPDDKMSRDELVAAMRRADVLVPCVTDSIDAAMLAQAGEKLKLIANYGAGVDHIDVASARQRGVLVSNTPGVVTEDTADMVMALILAVIRKIPEGLAEMQAGAWKGWAPMAHLGGRLGGRRLGILGMGRIGQAVARRARAFGLQIHYNNRRRLRPEIEQELDATWWESLDQMVSRMDIISVNCPHTPSTFHLMNARRLKLMKPTSVIVNTSRGEVIDENALTRMLRWIAAGPPLAGLIAAELRPGPGVVADADLVADFRARSGTVYHPSCTARMGGDPAASVVGPDLRVHGTEGLRVCDASVFPTLIGGNTNAPAILVGWMGADRILATAR